MLASLFQIVSRQEIVKNIEITSRFHLTARNQRFRAILGKNAQSAFYLFNNYDPESHISHSHDSALVLNLTSQLERISWVYIFRLNIPHFTF